MEYKKELITLIDQGLKQLKRGVNKAVLKVPEIEQKVLDATCNEPWGPHGTTMAEIAAASRNHEEYVIIMQCLWKRLASKGKNWRHVYKALTLLEYLIANGSERVAIDLLERSEELQALSLDFQYIEPPPPCEKDQGANIRKKAEALVALLHEKERLSALRAKAAANRHKYYGIASEEFHNERSLYGLVGDCHARFDALGHTMTDKDDTISLARRGSDPPSYEESIFLAQTKSRNRRETAPPRYFGAWNPVHDDELDGSYSQRDRYGRSVSLPQFNVDKFGYSIGKCSPQHDILNSYNEHNADKSGDNSFNPRK